MVRLVYHQHMSATPVPAHNPAAIALLVSGIIGVILGAILWTTGSNLLSQDTLAGGYLHAVGLDNGVDLSSHTTAMDADQTLIWWGITLVILGVLLLVARLIIAAASPRVVGERPSRPSTIPEPRGTWLDDPVNDK